MQASAALKVGDEAPSFMAQTHSGTRVNMNLQPVGSLTNDGYCAVLLWFYPCASTGECTAEGKKFEELNEQFKAKKVKVVGVSNDSKSKNAKFARECRFTYPLICDESLSISLAYGAATDAIKKRRANAEARASEAAAAKGKGR